MTYPQILIAGFLFVFLSAGVGLMSHKDMQPISARTVLERQGYRDVHIGDHCEQYGAAACFEFRAVDSGGRFVRGSIRRQWRWVG